MLWNVGNAPAPFDVRTCPDVPTLAILCCASVEVVPPQITAYAVWENLPVPPFATLSDEAQVKLKVDAANKQFVAPEIPICP